MIGSYQLYYHNAFVLLSMKTQVHHLPASNHGDNQQDNTFYSTLSFISSNGLCDAPPVNTYSNMHHSVK